MSTPVPQFDESPQATYAAVGIALSAWEEVEEAIATLHSVFVGQPRLVAALAQFGRDYAITAHRLSGLRKAAEVYFIKHSDQEREGEVRAVIASVENLSIFRHRIAHGKVRTIPVYDKVNEDGYMIPQLEYYLGAPLYALDRLQTNFMGIGGSADIVMKAFEFTDLAARIMRLVDALSPQS